MIYLTVILIAIIYALIRAKHDNYILDGKWKRWAFIEGVFITGVVTYLIGRNVADFILLPLIFGLWFWIVFDIACGLLRAGKVFYYGSGKFDQEMKRTTEKPFLLFVWKAIWLLIISGAWKGWIQEYF